MQNVIYGSAPDAGIRVLHKQNAGYITFQQWVERYERKTGDKVNIPEHFQLAFDEQHGFFCFKADNKDEFTFINIGPT